MEGGPFIKICLMVVVLNCEPYRIGQKIIKKSLVSQSVSFSFELTFFEGLSSDFKPTV
jgi:hypothetical protein